MILVMLLRPAMFEIKELLLSSYMSTSSPFKLVPQSSFMYLTGYARASMIDSQSSISIEPLESGYISNGEQAEITTSPFFICLSSSLPIVFPIVLSQEIL